MFHRPRRLKEPVNGHGYISNDGHKFECGNPAMLQQAYHVCVGRLVLSVEGANISNPCRIFVIDRLGDSYFLALYLMFPLQIWFHVFQ